MRYSPTAVRKHARPVAKPRTLALVDQRTDAQTSRVLMHARDVLSELHSLLGDYSPMWFTREHYERTEEILRELDRSIPARQSL